MSRFKFGQEVASKDFRKQRQVTDILTIDVNQIPLFNPFMYNVVKWPNVCQIFKVCLAILQHYA